MSRKPRAPKEDKRSEGSSERLDAFAALLVGKRTEAINYRSGSGLERRWLEDEDAYHGNDELNGRPNGVLDAATGVSRGGSPYSTSNQTQQIRARIYVHLSRQKTNAFAARISDMLLPTDDRNWSIQPTPVPELDDVMKTSANVEWGERDQNGQLQSLPHPTQDRKLTVADLAGEKMSKAQRACDGMQREIDDQLNECSFNRECRQVIMDAARLGVGVLKGPFVINRVSKKWTAENKNGKKYQKLTVKKDMRPASKRVDPWDFYPDPACGDDIHNGQYVFEREKLSRRKLAALQGVDGFLGEQIEKCLEEGPQAALPTADNERNSHTLEPTKDTRYELWTFTGEVCREELEAAEAEIDDDETDGSKLYSAVVVMCNSRVIKAIVNPMETGEFPYDTFMWEPVTNSWSGVGIPYLMRYSQKTINTGWRAMLDNAALSHGPQVVIDTDEVTPMDGQWQITGRKVWRRKKNGDMNSDASKAFQVFSIPNNQAELQNIIALAQKFADDETAMPQIAQGEQGSAPDTVGGMTILMNSANAVLRRVVRQWDDMMTRPHISRYYDWNMQFNENEEIKGDYQVDARGSSALVVRDEYAQELNVLIQSGAAHPIFGKYIDPKKTLREYLTMKKIPHDRVLRTDHEVMTIEQNQAKAPPNPAIQVAEMRAQATIKAAEINAQGQAREQEIEAQSEQNNLMLAREKNADERAANMAELQIKREIMMLEYAAKRELTLEQVKAQLTGKIIEANTQKELKAAEIAIQSRRDDQQQAHLDRQQKSSDAQFMVNRQADDIKFDRTQRASEQQFERSQQSKDAQFDRTQSAAEKAAQQASQQRPAQ